MYTENIIRNLDTIEGHMQYKRPSELEETHREENEISEFGGPYKTNYESGRISTGHGLEVNPDHPHTTRQRGRSPNSDTQPKESSETHREESEISDFSRLYKTFFSRNRGLIQVKLLDYPYQ